MKEWILIKDLIGIEELAGTPQGIAQRAKKENWRRRRVTGVKGNVFEYYVGDMPASVQQALGFKSDGNEAVALPPRFVPAQAADSLERVPFYHINASAGFSALSEGAFEPDDYIGLSKQWLEARGFYLRHLAFITACGDSMHPTIADGDMLLLNLSEKKPKDGKIYVLRSGEQIWVKRVQGIINGIRLISDNQALYRPVDVIFNEALDFEVIGQVVYIGHDLL